MKNTGIVILCCIFVIIILPLVNKKSIYINETDIIISVFNAKENKVIEMELEEYVLKVLEKEMPPTYKLDALKAQAIAIRTYAMKKRGHPFPNITVLKFVPNINIVWRMLMMKKNYGAINTRNM